MPVHMNGNSSALFQCLLIPQHSNTGDHAHKHNDGYHTSAMAIAFSITPRTMRNI